MDVPGRSVPVSMKLRFWTFPTGIPYQLARPGVDGCSKAQNWASAAPVLANYDRGTSFAGRTVSRLVGSLPRPSQTTQLTASSLPSTTKPLHAAVPEATTSMHPDYSSLSITSLTAAEISDAC